MTTAATIDGLTVTALWLRQAAEVDELAARVLHDLGERMMTAWRLDLARRLHGELERSRGGPVAVDVHAAAAELSAGLDYAAPCSPPGSSRRRRPPPP